MVNPVKQEQEKNQSANDLVRPLLLGNPSLTSHGIINLLKEQGAIIPTKEAIDQALFILRRELGLPLLRKRHTDKGELTYPPGHVMQVTNTPELFFRVAIGQCAEADDARLFSLAKLLYSRYTEVEINEALVKVRHDPVVKCNYKIQTTLGLEQPNGHDSNILYQAFMAQMAQEQADTRARIELLEKSVAQNDPRLASLEQWRKAIASCQQ
jgi:hypothetical protein